jgi:3-hydroxyisobutyrate dehydrogenase-like beta-hydroxyacid dehydrogenase
MFASNASGTIFADHSTLFPTTLAILQVEAREKRMHYLACPVFGPPAAAKSAGLLIVTSGDEKARDTIKEYLVPTLGKKTIDCGYEPQKGAVLKILGNSCIPGTIELLSESFTMAEKTGFDTELFYEFIRE